MISNNILKWLRFSGLPDVLPIMSIRFKAFAQTKGPFETLADDDRPPNPPGRHGDQPTDEEPATHDGAGAAQRSAISDREKRQITLWSHLAMMLNSTSFMLMRQDCADKKGLGDGHKA